MGLAVDWIGHNLFWTDEGMRSIFVTSLQDSAKVARYLKAFGTYYTTLHLMLIWRLKSSNKI